MMADAFGITSTCVWKKETDRQTNRKFGGQSQEGKRKTSSKKFSIQLIKPQERGGDEEQKGKKIQTHNHEDETRERSENGKTQGKLLNKQANKIELS